MPPTVTRQQQINVFLLKPTITNAEDAVRNNDTAPTPYEIHPALGQGRLFVRSVVPHPPGWDTLIRTFTPRTVSAISAASPGAVLVLKVDARWFAITFGQGRHLIGPGSYERQFGLRATLGLADPDSLCEADSSEWDHSPKHRRTSTARRGNIRAFNLNELEMLRGMVGKPRDTALGSQISGKDSALLWCELSTTNLAGKCRALLAGAQQPINADDYPMVGNVTVVDDPAEIRRLDDAMLLRLQNDSLDFADVAPPEVVNWENVEGFRIPDRQRRNAPAILDLSLARLEDLQPRATWTIDWLKGKHICATDANGHTRQQWSVYDCLLTEFEDAGSRVALFAGDWLRLQPDFVQRVNDGIATIPVHTAYAFPTVNATEHEGRFNDRVAGLSAGRLLKLDRQTIVHGGRGSRIEVCDLLDIQTRTFYHVKDKFRSAGLSHLFTQAAVSTELLREDSDFRSKVRTAYASTAGLFPDDAPALADYTVVLAIISTRSTPPVRQMPFLGKVRLDSLRKQLRRLGLNRLEVLTLHRT